MQSSPLFSTLIWVNTSRAVSNRAMIYLRITLDRKRINLSLKHEIDLELWDNDKKKLRGRGPQAQSINRYLEEVKADIFQAYQELKSESKSITLQKIKARFLGLDQNFYSLQGLIDYHNDKMAHK